LPIIFNCSQVTLYCVIILACHPYCLLFQITTNFSPFSWWWANSRYNRVDTSWNIHACKRSKCHSS